MPDEANGLAAEPQHVTEFFAPFAHVPGRIEWCRIRSPTHGVFDTCIILGASTAEPATVYVDGDVGERFMAERYPECTAIRVAAGALHIVESKDGLVVEGSLEAPEGPVRSASMRFEAHPAIPREVAYGSLDKPVWGGRFSCVGVDLELDAAVTGEVQWEGRVETFAGDGIVTVGSMGRIAPRAAW